MIPLPEDFKKLLADNTLTRKIIQGRYNKFLIKLGLRNDFDTDILKDFNKYQTLFEKDVKNECISNRNRVTADISDGFGSISFTIKHQRTENFGYC